MGNDITSYRAAIGRFHIKCKRLKVKSSNLKGSEYINLGLLLLLLSTWKNLAYSFFICIFLLSLCVDIHPHPGPNTPTNAQMPNIRLCNLNIHSIKKPGRFDQIVEKLAPNYDIITMTETWLKKETLDSTLELKNFNGPHRLDRPDGKAGGVMAWVRDTLITKRKKCWELDGIELMWLELRTSNQKFIVGTAYRPPGGDNKSTFWDDLQISLSLVAQSGIHNIILTGDFNADKSTNKTAGDNLFKFLTSNSLYQHVTKPTILE
jgi:hypothetical protein